MLPKSQRSKPTQGSTASMLTFTDHFSYAEKQRRSRCCTKGSLRSPSVQRGAAAPLLHEVLPTVAHRTTTVLQN